jgi:hypothetical protein
MQQLADEFEKLCQQRHEMGAKQYGPVAFLQNDMITFISEELADICNYSKYMYVKLRLFEEMYESSLDSTRQLPGIGVKDWYASGPSPSGTIE